jgi:serine/threonine-protein kinase
MLRDRDDHWPEPTLSSLTHFSDRSPIPEEPREKEGDVLGSYQLVELIGEGSMGRVFLARHTRLGRQVALKVLRPEHLHNRSLVQRFFQEARSVNQINHEHIVEVADFVEELDASGLGRVYCVMELLVGSSLSQLQTKEALGVARCARIAQQVCAALEAAHQLGVVHRDVKPDNIFITERNGEKDYVKVLDFGVAKLTRPLGDTPGTMEGAIVGTPAYMSPEQAAGLGTDYRADIYGVGVVLYEMLSGRPPFEGVAFGQLVVQIITQSPPSLPSTTPAGERIPSEFKSLVMGCLEKEPSNRPQSMAALGEALQPFAAGLRRSAPRGTYAAVAVGALAIAALGAMVFLRSPLGPPKTTATASPKASGVVDPLPSSARSPLEPTRLVSGSPSTAANLPPSSQGELTATDKPAAVDTRPAPAPARRPKRKMNRDGIIDPFAN